MLDGGTLPSGLALFQAYSLVDREVGYCQGSAFIVGLLLMQVGCWGVAEILPDNSPPWARPPRDEQKWRVLPPASCQGQILPLYPHP